jgi:hypothetical protein
MRAEYRSSGTVDCPMLFSVATKRVTISGQRFDFIQTYLLPQKRVSVSRCLATDVSAMLFRLHISGGQASCHNIHTHTHYANNPVY